MQINIKSHILCYLFCTIYNLDTLNIYSFSILLVPIGIGEGWSLSQLPQANAWQQSGEMASPSQCIINVICIILYYHFYLYSFTVKLHKPSGVVYIRGFTEGCKGSPRNFIGKKMFQKISPTMARRISF